ncbi:MULTISPECIES: general stress protein [Bacillus]|uniref:general stress protein n=1 Tax=Bacillus TaxID=1386 RepID=UPI0005D3787C|nr:general stress protein [Bacillus altitudinis]KQL42861.1 general stress protein 17m [Bacillus sp. FJAT-21955]KJF49094.1 general stress protein 17m [Bacillus altitudinis]MBU8651716.1 general stress protein [Bacillus altitudinis]MBU8693384.1 general stress protein [Bacillus altitudinis]MBU8777044.1 general stress protein [Bacillus altitudinis]
MEFFTVENSKEAKQTIEQIQSAKDDVFVFAYDPERSDTVTEYTKAKSMTAVDQGILDQIANVIRTRDDELMAKMMSTGADQELALTLLEELKKGKLVICKR